jgi:hypothetical protein
LQRSLGEGEPQSVPASYVKRSPPVNVGPPAHLGGEKMPIMSGPAWAGLAAALQGMSSAMSMLVATQILALATVVLAGGAIVTALFAILAFRKQSEEVRTLKDQLGQQSTEVGVLQDQLKEQRKLNEEQTPVLRLQYQELQASLDQRRQEAKERRRAQASRVFLTREFLQPGQGVPGPAAIALAQEARRKRIRGAIQMTVVNTSSEPVYGLEFLWHRDGKSWGKPDRTQGPVMPGKGVSAVRTLPPRLPAAVSTDLFGAAVRFRDANQVAWLRSADGQLDDIEDDQAASGSS